MHPDLEEILAVRDGEAAPEAARHIASCAQCARELERLRSVRDSLRAIPAEPPVHDLWPETRSRIQAGSTWQRWARIAAVLALALAGTAALWLGFRTAPPQPLQAPPLRADAAAPGGIPDELIPVPEEETGGPIRDPELARLIRRSHRLESVLDRMDRNPTVVSGREALAQMGIEGRLAELDIQLGGESPAPAGREERVGLWQERVQLLGALTKVKSGKRRTAEI